MTIYRFVVRFLQADPRSAGYNSDARALGFDNLRIRCQDLYFIEGQLLDDDCQQLALQLLTDPVTQLAEYSILDELGGKNLLSKTQSTVKAGYPELASVIIEVALRSGVTDPVSEQLVRVAHELGFEKVRRASTGMRFLIDGADLTSVEKLATRLLVNNVIQQWVLGEIRPTFPQEIGSSGVVDIIPICAASDDDLLLISKERRAALDLVEMKVIQDYFITCERDPTDVEFEMIAQTWSEHCVHKTFKAKIDVNDYRIMSNIGDNLPWGPAYPDSIDSIIKAYLKAATDEINAPWVISAFVDNAGIIEFDDEYEISFKVETHNHPSAIEPFGGANTGVGGVIRDVIGVSAKPIANTDVLCFGLQDAHLDSLPEGVLHPRRIQSGVVAGVQDYGNKIGIPTVNGAILYDDGFAANPLVFCGCVGLAPRGKHIKAPRPGDRIVIIGGRTGRDGLRGATFSSMTMDAQTGSVSGASVQIGDPITEKGLIDVVVRARDMGLYTDITDCGAGGLSSAVGEMTSQIGGDVDLAVVQLKYPGLAPWEIWLSEAQERMVLAVAPENMLAMQELCNTFDTELTDIGVFHNDGRIVVRYDKNIVLDLSNEFLHNGIPQRQLRAIIGSSEEKWKPVSSSDIQFSMVGYANLLLELLSHPDIASKASVIRLYDHEIQGGTVVKPLSGIQNDGPSDAAVLKPIGTKGNRGIVLANGINPQYGKRDAYKMAWSVLDEAVRNAVAVGADPGRIAILDNFCWGDPLQPETLGSLVEAALGCHDAAIHYRTPYISGKDSLNNEYMGVDGFRHAIPPTLLISALGIIEDINKSVTMDLKEVGNPIYLVGDFQPVFGGTHAVMVSEELKVLDCETIPSISELAPKIYRALNQAMMSDLVRSTHDLSEGGLAVAAAEMCIGGRLGLELILVGDDPLRVLFGETNGCLLVEIKLEKVREFEMLFANLPILRVAMVTSDLMLRMRQGVSTLLALPVDQLVSAWNKKV